MYDDLQLWLDLIRQYVNKDAVIEDGKILVGSPMIIEYPLWDPAVVLNFMNYAPHLLQETYLKWTQGHGDNIARIFCISLHELAIQSNESKITSCNEFGTKVLTLADSIMDSLFNLFNFGERQTPAKPVKKPQSTVFKPGTFKEK